jgi:hypothetical protein
MAGQPMMPSMMHPSQHGGQGHMPAGGMPPGMPGSLAAAAMPGSSGDLSSSSSSSSGAGGRNERFCFTPFSSYVRVVSILFEKPPRFLIGHKLSPLFSVALQNPRKPSPFNKRNC